MTDFKIEARARGADASSSILTDSESCAEFYYSSLAASGKWERVTLWTGSIRMKEWIKDDRRV